MGPKGGTEIGLLSSTVSSDPDVVVLVMLESGTFNNPSATQMMMMSCGKVEWRRRTSSCFNSKRDGGQERFGKREKKIHETR